MEDNVVMSRNGIYRRQAADYGALGGGKTQIFWSGADSGGGGVVAAQCNILYKINRICVITACNCWRKQYLCYLDANFIVGD